jgi:hypothetical protein
VGLQHLGRGVEQAHGLVEPSLGNLEEHEGQQRVADAGRLDLRAEAADHAALLEPRQARLHGPARHAEAPRDLHQPDPRLAGHRRDETGVELIDRTGHGAQNIPAQAGHNWPIRPP